MDTIESLNIPVPPMLEEALGYQGKARWVVFYWTPCGDELRYNDGTTEADGSWHAWLAFKRHPCIAPHLEPYHLGSSEEEARHWLLLDRESRTLYVGEASAVEHFLLEHRPPPPVLTEEQIQALCQRLEEQWPLIRSVDPQDVEERMRREEQLVRDLKDWLDAR